MKNIIKIFFNITIIIFISFSTLIFYTENTSTFSKEISNGIEEQFLKNYDINSKIDSIKIKWKGINPNIYITNLKLNDTNNNVLLETPASILRINLLKSLFDMTISINEIIINNTSIVLVRENSKFYFNDLNLTKESNKNGNKSIPKIILKNSSVRLTNKNSNDTINFNINTFIVSHNNNKLNINANFFHQSSLEPITFIYRERQEENNLVSRVYLSGNSVKLPYNILPASFQQIKSDRISLRIWIDFSNMKINKIIGNISANKLDVKLPYMNLKIKDVNSDILFVKNKTSDILSLMRLNYKVNNKRVNNNKIIIKKNKSKEIKVYIKKSSFEMIKALSNKSNFLKGEYFAKLEKTNIKNLQLHTSNKDILNYFVFSIDFPSIKINEEYHAHDISLDVYGNLQKGKIGINSLSLSNNKNNLLDKINGSITYNIKGKSVYFSSSNLIDEHGHKILITGKKISKYPSLKINISSNLSKVSDLILKSRANNIIELSGNLNSDIYYHQNNIFSKTQINKFYLNNSNLIYLSSDKINLFYSSNMINSNKFILNVNNHPQKSKITTNINSKSFKYIMTSMGEVETNLLTNLLKIDNNFIKGKALIKSNIIFDKTNDNLSIFASSDLRGVSINAAESLIKKPKDKINLILNYQHSPSTSYPLKVSIDKHNFQIKNDLDNVYLKIKSPAARGYLKYPKSSNDGKVINGSFEYINTNFFTRQGYLTSIPKIDIKSKHLKSNDVVFDNFHLIMNPKKDYIEITKLDFNNLHLKMKSSGKWYIGEEQITQLSANIESDNFGLALKTLGYSNIIRGGQIKAKLIGSWEGSIQNFAFSKTKGSLNFDINNGQINEIDKGTQAISQVLGLFSISSIPKRLSLDFSDFFSRGLSFDNLNANIILDSGIANTKKMLIVGSFGEMRLSGKSDLVKKTHDQVLIFIPDLSSTSLLTGAVLGGPIGAAASIFYDKLLKEFGVDTNKLAGIEYSIKGPWKDPQIKVTQSFKPITN